jgi:hypothetical protein
MRRAAKWALVVVVLLALVGALNQTAPKSEQPRRDIAATPSTTPLPTSTPRPSRHARTRTHRAETPTPTATQAATPVAFVSCDANIRAQAATTTCPFAENVFYEYYEATFGYPDSVTVQAWSPAAARFFRVDCVGDHAIVCRAGDGAQVRFSATAVTAYDDDQAARFASTHEVGGDDPDDVPGGVGENIPNYENGTGYRVQCADGMYSHSGGRPGACSGHGGVGYDPIGDSSDDGSAEPDYGSGDEIPNYENGTGYRVQCADGMYSHSGGRPGACSGHGGVG